MDDERRAAEQRAADRREDAALVDRARADDPEAFGQLYDRWFDRVHDLAYRVTNDSAAAGDVAQDAFLAAWQKLGTLQDPEAFGGWLLRITRNAALDRRRREERARPHDSEGMAMIEAAGPSPASAPAGFRVEDRTVTAEDPSRAAEDGELVALLWESAAALGERDSEVLDLMLRHGLAPAEIGEVVGLNRNAANQAVHRARNRLKSAVEARVLWRSGEPVCVGLSAALEQAKVKHFGADAVRVTTRHAETCAECRERRQTRLEPSKLFAAAPLVIGPILLKMKVAHALSESGVPMDGSSATGAGDGGASGSQSPWRRRLRRVGVGAGVIIGALVLVVVFATAVDEVTETRETASRTTVTTLAVTTTAGTDPLTSTTLATTVTTIKGAVPPPPVPPTVPPTAPPETGSATISVSPAQEPAGYTAGRVVLRWTTTGGTSVSVSGSGFGGSSAPSGTGLPCPPSRTGGCGSAGGVYTYTVVVRGSSGQTLATSSATLSTV